MVVRRRQGLGNSKDRKRMLVEESRSEPARLGKMSEAISPNEKVQDGKVAIAREYMHLWSESVRGDITYWLLLKANH